MHLVIAFQGFRLEQAADSHRAVFTLTKQTVQLWPCGQ